MQSGHGAWAGGRPSHERGHGEGTRPSPREGAQRGNTERGTRPFPREGTERGARSSPQEGTQREARLGGGARNGRCSGQAREPGRRSGAIEVQDDMRGRGHNNRTDGAPEAKNTDP